MKNDDNTVHALTLPIGRTTHILIVIIDYKLAPEGNYSCGDSEKRKGEKLMTGEIIARTLLKTKLSIIIKLFQL